jgi:hypothetical protein
MVMGSACVLGGVGGGRVQQLCFRIVVTTGTGHGDVDVYPTDPAMAPRAVLVGVAVGLVTAAAPEALAGIAMTELLLAVTGWIVLWPMDAFATHQNARRRISGLVAIVPLLLIGPSETRHIGAAVALCSVFMA